MPKLAKNGKPLQNIVNECENTQKRAEISYENCQKYPKMSANDQQCPKLSRYVQQFWKISRNVQKCPTTSKNGQETLNIWTRAKSKKKKFKEGPPDTVFP